MYGDGDPGGQSIFVRASIFESWRCAVADGAQPGADDAFIGYGVHKNRECGRADWHDYRRSPDGGFGENGGGAGDGSSGVDAQIAAWGKRDSPATNRSCDIDASG